MKEYSNVTLGIEFKPKPARPLKARSIDEDDLPKAPEEFLVNYPIPNNLSNYERATLVSKYLKVLTYVELEKNDSLSI